jgi:hypothetical protein
LTAYPSKPKSANANSCAWKANRKRWPPSDFASRRLDASRVNKQRQGFGSAVDFLPRTTMESDEGLRMANTPELKQGNKYKRAFSFRVHEGESTQAADGLVRLSGGDYPDILEDYLAISRKRQRNPTAMANLQTHILLEAGTHENAVKHYKAQTPEADAHKKFVESQIFTHRMIGNTLRVIGDGIAWRAFRFDRSVPRVLSQNAVKQTVISDGLLAEMNVWSSEFFQQGQFPIMNSITNCLAMGDITVVSDDGSIEVVEVKTNKTKSGRKIKQKNRLKDAMELLNGVGTVDEKLVKIGTLPLTPQNHLAALGELLEKADKDGVSGSRVAPHCYLECLDMSKLRNLPETFARLEQQRLGQTRDWNEGLTLPMDSMDLLNFTPNVAPFSIFPFPERTCIELAMGKKIYTCYLNIGFVIDCFVRNGWTVEKQMQEALAETDNLAFLMLNKRGFSCHLPPGDFARLHMELLTPESIVAECEHLRGLGREHEGEYGYWLFEGEGSQWL